MKRSTAIFTGFCCLVAASGAGAEKGNSAKTAPTGGPVALTQASGGDFTLERSVIAAGGGQSSGGVFSLRGTVGQAASDTSEGGDFSLRGGFWTSVEALPREDRLFADGFEY